LIKVFLNIIILLFIFLIGVYAGGIYSNWGTIKLSFLNVRLTEILQILSTLSIAFIINYILNKENNKSNMQKKIICELFDELDSKFSLVYSDGLDTMNDKIKCTPQQILNKIEYISSLLNIFKNTKFTKNNLFNDEKDLLLNDFFKFKELLTDDPLTVDEEKYSEDTKEKFTSKFNDIKNKILNLKLRLYQ
jgi:uncharacterized cysteine cluster protein YcgN (CxxCxxCC family)